MIRRKKPSGARRCVHKGRFEVPGWVYALPFCGPGHDLVKVGHTHSPVARAEWLRRCDWPFKEGDDFPLTVWAVEVENRIEAERRAFTMLERTRVQGDRPGTKGKRFHTELVTNDLEAVRRMIGEVFGRPMVAMAYTLSTIPMAKPKYRSNLIRVPHRYHDKWS